MELWELVRLVSERYGKRLEEHKKALSETHALGEITLQQFQYLQALRISSTPTVSYLSAYFGVRSPTATVIVARLEEKGFITRAPDSEDRRSHRLVLTAKARQLLSAQEKAFKALSEDIKAALSPTELRSYANLTEKVCLAFEKHQQPKKRGNAK